MIKLQFNNKIKKIVVWSIIILISLISIKFGIDKKVVVLATLFLGFFTQIFSGLGAMIALVPWIGPIIIKLFTIPFFWLVNGMGYFVSIIAIKKGYTRQVTSSRVLTIAILFGIIIGYTLGNIIPIK